MPNTIIFSNTNSYRKRRAYVTVELQGLGPRGWVNFDVLVDTGADFLVLPEAAALAVGLNLTTGMSVPVKGVTGSTTMQLLRSCHITVENIYPIRVDVLFGRGVMPLLGMDAMLAAMETGFQARHWHYV